MIKIINLKKRFGEKEVLKGLNLEIKDGHTTVIIGPSGCGKTVLLKHIVGLLKPDEGEIFIEGEDITKLKNDKLFKLREKIGVVFQGSALLDSLTVAENIILGVKEHRKLTKQEYKEIVREKLKMVKLEGTENLMPSELSGGMKKRVAIARALAMEPKYILYDEPTTALDPITADKIDELICELKEKVAVTAIAVTHDLVSAYRIGDTIAMFGEGRIVFEGTPEEIKKCNNLIVKNFIEGRGR
jgi:phospholipid/cholesterol/gamma-HCH transport system ATP-binding protein